MFTGTKYAGWREYIPSNRRRVRALGQTAKYYSFVKDRAPEVVGHNPIAALTYLIMYAIFTFQVISGFALLSYPHRSGPEWFISGWLANWLGITEVRLIHHLVTWAVITFVVIHLYAAIMVDRAERGGELSSMFTGYKTLPQSVVDETADDGSAAPTHSSPTHSSPTHKAPTASVGG
jgi:Ni/Fe-hydrogenase 1 B-type cytochrome subunit